MQSLLLLIASGLRAAHSRPLAKWHKSEVTRRGGRRVPTAEGFRFPLVEMQPANSWAVLALDLDGREKFKFADSCLEGLLPPGNDAVERIQSGNLHIFYYMKTPIHTGPNARMKPMELFRRVSEYFTNISGADPSYNRLLMRNPIQSVHLDPRALDGPCRTHSGPRNPYALLDLLRYVPKGWHVPKAPQTSEGGHIALIKAAAKWYGMPSHWYATREELERELHRINEVMGHPRPSVEVQEITSWMHRKQTDRLARGEQQGKLSMIQTARAVRSGASRRELTHDRDKAIIQAVSEGRTLRDVGLEYGLSKDGVRWIVARLV